MGKIGWVFGGYYFGKGFERWVCDEELGLVEKVYDLKDGKERCREYF